MNAVLDPELHPGHPSAASRAIIERLIGFKTVSRDSNLGLIEWVRDYLQSFGAVTRLTHDATGKKANLFATLGDSNKPGLILSGHTDVVPVDGQSWDTDPFAVVERDGKLFARGSADMKGFIGIALAQAPKFVAALNGNRLDAPLHYSLSYDEEVGCIGVRGLIRDLEENNIRPTGWRRSKRATTDSPCRIPRCRPDSFKGASPPTSSPRSACSNSTCAPCRIPRPTPCIRRSVLTLWTWRVRCKRWMN